jgi:hypothetical protein
MNDRELLLFLENTKHWDQTARDVLVDEWNKRRTDIGQIGKNQVRTPCRLRAIRDSLKLYLLKPVKNGQSLINV